MTWNKTFKKIEKALGFKLYDWQKAYISLESDFVPEGRCVGATTAFILRWLLNYGEKIDNFEPYENDQIEHARDARRGLNYWELFPCDNPMLSVQYVVHIYHRMVVEINYKLHQAGIDTCFESAIAGERKWPR